MTHPTGKTALSVIVTVFLSGRVAQQVARPAEWGALQMDAASLPFVRNVDKRFQSFQIGFSHLTGGETWKSYDQFPKGQIATDVSQVREPRAPTDLTNPKLRTLTAAL